MDARDTRNFRDLQQFESRKRDHLKHALDPQNEAQGQSALDAIRLRHEALPELDFETVSIASQRLGESSPTPFYISGMTAGHSGAVELNRRLARVAQERGWAMGLGSQRRDLEQGSGAASPAASPDDWRLFRKHFPNLVVFSNLGLSQVIQAVSQGSRGIDPIKALIDAVGAQALAIHLNALQEVLQPEGTPRFAGGLKAIEKICRELRPLGVAVVVKETGCGISPATLKLLKRTGIRAVDVSGLGGTHWGRIEGARAQDQSPGSRLAQAAQTFRDWGISTAQATQDAARVFATSGSSRTQKEVWASGGVRSGLDAAKLIALGAHQVGYAKPALEAALKGEQELAQWMEQQEFELRVALFCTGSKTLKSLKGKVQS